MGGDTYPVIRAAAVHAASVFLDREASTDKACKLIEDAAEGGSVVAFQKRLFWIPLLDLDTYLLEHRFLQSTLLTVLRWIQTV